MDPKKPRRKRVQRVAPKGLDAFIQEFKGLLKKHGLGSYGLVVKDPDTLTGDFAIFDGNTSWIYGRMALLLEEVRDCHYQELESASEVDFGEENEKGGPDGHSPNVR